jgi:hypothetical protein
VRCFDPRVETPLCSRERRLIFGRNRDGTSHASHASMPPFTPFVLTFMCGALVLVVDAGCNERQ